MLGAAKDLITVSEKDLTKLDNDDELSPLGHEARAALQLAIEDVKDEMRPLQRSALTRKTPSGDPLTTSDPVA